MPIVVPKQPHLRSPCGKGADSRQMINPMKGVKITEIKKAHPNPIFRLAPNNPTNTAKSDPVNKPTSSNEKAITYNLLQK